jgi:hypothetical protein
LEKFQFNFFIAEDTGVEVGLYWRPAVILAQVFGTMKKIGGLLSQLFILQPPLFEIRFELFDFLIQPVDTTTAFRLDVAQGLYFFYQHTGNIVSIFADGDFQILFQVVALFYSFLIVLPDLIPRKTDLLESGFPVNQGLFHIPEMLFQQQSLVFNLIHDTVDVCFEQAENTR